MAFNLFEAPEYYQGLLGEDATKKLQNKALTTGLINAAIGYIAQPKTGGYGSALPYIGRALAGGLQAGQETIRSGITDYETQQKIAEMQRKQKQQQALQGMLSGITDPNERLLAELNTEAYVTNKLKPKERKVEKVGRQLVDVTGDTPTVLFTGEAEEKAGASTTLNKLLTERSNLAQTNPNDPNLRFYDDAIRKETSKSEGINISYGAPVAGADAQGNPVFFQPSKTGGAPTIVPGVTPPAPKPAESATKQLTGIENLQSAIGDYRARLKTWSPLDAADPKKRADMTTTYNNMMLQAKEAYGLGVLNGPDYKILTDTVADPTSAKGLIYGAAGALDPQAAALDRLMGNMKQTIKSTQPGAKKPRSKADILEQYGVKKNGG
jgi:hypothetical protein